MGLSFYNETGNCWELAFACNLVSETRHGEEK